MARLRLGSPRTRNQLLPEVRVYAHSFNVPISGHMFCNSLSGKAIKLKKMSVGPLRFRITELETAEVPAALQHTWSGHAKSHVSEVYKKLLKQREWRLRWAQKAGTGFTLPGHRRAAAETPNGKSGKILQFRKVG